MKVCVIYLRASHFISYRMESVVLHLGSERRLGVVAKLGPRTTANLNIYRKYSMQVFYDGDPRLPHSQPASSTTLRRRIRTRWPSPDLTSLHAIRRKELAQRRDCTTTSRNLSRRRGCCDGRCRIPCDGGSGSRRDWKNWACDD